MKIVRKKINGEMVYYVVNEEGEEEKEENEIGSEEIVNILGKKSEGYLVVNSSKNIDGTPKGHVLGGFDLI
jgi:hypothetical protein